MNALIGLLLALSNLLLSAGDITVATFNINGGYDHEGGSWRDRLPGVVDTMIAADADIYLLQEAHEEAGEHRQVQAEMRRQTGVRWKMVEGDGGNHMLIDSTTLAVLDQHTVRLPHARHYSEALIRRCATGEEFWVWNTHLIATSRRDRPTEVAKKMRAEQVAAFAGRLHSVSIGGGDINEWPETNTRNLLSTVGHDDVRSRTTDVTNAGWDSHQLNYRDNLMRGHWIDMLAAGPDVKVQSAGLVDSKSASDHNLIWATINMKETP